MKETSRGWWIMAALLYVVYFLVCSGVLFEVEQPQVDWGFLLIGTIFIVGALSAPSIKETRRHRVIKYVIWFFLILWSAFIINLRCL